MTSHAFVILAYKESPFLEECIRSLIAQTKKSEIMISTSTPNAHIESIAGKFNIPVYVNAEPKGIASDWNNALHCVNRDFITLAHQDDIYEPNYWETVSSMFRCQEDLLIAFTNYCEFDQHGIRQRGLNLFVKDTILKFFFGGSIVIRSRFIKMRFLGFGSPICCPAVTYNLKMLGDFKFTPDFGINLDWEAWIRMASMSGAFGYAKGNSVRHRIHGDSETSVGIIDNRRQREDSILMELLWPFPISRILIWFYQLSYFSNRVK